ncbi:MAG TPA: DUF5667 domain-containing protein [Patescibacteria group bacterium]|nr:DUF5667 domain-containing protein [Patescibacteria group bacterium]
MSRIRILFSFGVVLLAIAVLVMTYARQTGVQASMEERQELSTVPVGVRLDQLFSRPILPDNPLYNLKMLRDRVQLMTTVEEDRPPLMLTFANARLTAAQILFTRGRTSLALTTLSKGEKYIFAANAVYVNSPKIWSEDRPYFDYTVDTHLQALSLIQAGLVDGQRAYVDQLIAQLSALHDSR